MGCGRDAEPAYTVTVSRWNVKGGKNSLFDDAVTDINQPAVYVVFDIWLNDTGGVVVCSCSAHTPACNAAATLSNYVRHIHMTVHLWMFPSSNIHQTILAVWESLHRQIWEIELPPIVATWHIPPTYRTIRSRVSTVVSGCPSAE